MTCLEKHLMARRPDLIIQTRQVRLEKTTAIVDLAREYDVLADGSDNFPTRFAANDAAMALGMPLVHGGATGGMGQVMSMAPGRSACLRCLFGGPPQEEGPNCRNQGVLGSLVGEVGWLMVLEASYWLTGQKGHLLDRLLTIDAWAGKRRIVPLRQQPDCPVCHP
ncbi:MAG: ThiF family adenylyltransferase [Magnetococcales bacterium]|nr:ThiF family adenylyltransferase [Magnetococcales bacterium]